MEESIDPCVYLPLIGFDITGISQVLCFVDWPSPAVPTVGEVLLMMRVSNHLVASFVMLACQKLFQRDYTGNHEWDLGKKYSFEGSECDDTQEQGNESQDLQFGDG